VNSSDSVPSVSGIQLLRNLHRESRKPDAFLPSSRSIAISFANSRIISIASSSVLGSKRISQSSHNIKALSDSFQNVPLYQIIKEKPGGLNDYTEQCSELLHYVRNDGFLL